MWKWVLASEFEGSTHNTIRNKVYQGLVWMCKREWLEAFLSPQRANVTQWSNYLTLMGRDLDFTIKLSASTGKEYCVSTGKCNSKIKLVTSTGIDLDNIRENLPALVHNIGNWSKQLYSSRTHLWGRRGGSQRHHLSSNITNNILLAFKFELTQKYSASKSRHH